MTTPRFLVSPEALRSLRTELTGAELRHLRVRRLWVGSAVLLFDGAGHQRRGIVTALDHRHAAIRLTADEPPPQRESPLRLVLAQALLKGYKLDLVIEKTVELGVSEVLLFTCERAVGRVSAARFARWTRVARSAAKQCQRSIVPTIGEPVPFVDLLARQTDTLRLLFWEEWSPGSLEAVRRVHPHVESVLAVIGPEGGFSPAEAQRAAAADFRLVGLGPRILRAETAAVAAVTLCQFLWGDLGGEALRNQRPTLAAPPHRS